MKDVTRREVITVGAKATVALVVPSVILGCGDPETRFERVVPVPNGRPAPPPAPLTLTFRETDEFYRQIDAAVGRRRVEIDFDGNSKVGKDSRLLQYLRDAENFNDVLRKTKAHDTEAGRRALAVAFAPELLSHQLATVEQAASNEIIEPGTVIIVVLGILALMTIVVTASRYHADLQVSTIPPKVRLVLEPA